MDTIALIGLMMTGSELAQAGGASLGQPKLPAAGVMWPFPLLMLVAVLFVSAACIGWYVRFEMPEEVPPAHSHDEPPGASHHHGAEGMQNPAPEPKLTGHD